MQPVARPLGKPTKDEEEEDDDEHETSHHALREAGLGVVSCVLAERVTGVSRELGIDDKVFVFSDKMVNNVVAAICSNTIYTYAACICPRGVEGMTFAAMTGLFNLGGAFSALMSTSLIDIFDVHCDEDAGGKLSNCRFGNLWHLVAVTALSNVVPLLFISWVPKIMGFIRQIFPNFILYLLLRVTPYTSAPPKASDVIVCEEVVQDDIAAVPHKTGKRRTVSMPHVVRNN
eukprot:jgi/Bigna1/70588/fgenesh1_pg.12_\